MKQWGDELARRDKAMMTLDRWHDTGHNWTQLDIGQSLMHVRASRRILWREQV